MSPTTFVNRLRKSDDITPLTCGVPIVSKHGNPACLCKPTWITNGKWTCGRHKSCAHTFIPFDCSICMVECTTRKDIMDTKCNHQFHKKCMRKWKESCTTILTCPLCRTVLHIPSPPASPPSLPTLHEQIEMNVIRIARYTVLIENITDRINNNQRQMAGLS
jgi:hypothetical protein